HSTVEFELRSRHRFTTRDQARRVVMAWIEEYNTERLHSTNGMICPVDYENGRRRPDAKTYAQLRPRPRAKHEHLSGSGFAPAGHPGKRRRGSGGVPRDATGPPLSGLKGAAASLRDRPVGRPLTPETSAAPGAGDCGQAGGLPRCSARHTNTP